MQATLQSILDAEMQAKKIIEEALKKINQQLDEESSNIEQRLADLEAQYKDKHEKWADELKIKMKSVYANKLQWYDEQVNKINNIDVWTEINKAADIFLQSTNG